MGLHNLRPEQLTALELLANGHNRKAVSKKMNLSPATVARVTRTAATELGTESIMHAVAIVASLGGVFVHTPDEDEIQDFKNQLRMERARAAFMRQTGTGVDDA